jgi:hypothetical protein
MKKFTATVALLSMYLEALADQPTPTTTLAAQLSTCIEEELKKECKYGTDDLGDLLSPSQRVCL